MGASKFRSDMRVCSEMSAADSGLRADCVGKPQILLCFDNVKYIESAPDTLIFFTNGDSIIVREGLEEVQRRFIELLR